MYIWMERKSGRCLIFSIPLQMQITTKDNMPITTSRALV
jgi:hypothetical protein